MIYFPTRQVILPWGALCVARLLLSGGGPTGAESFPGDGCIREGIRHEESSSKNGGSMSVSEKDNEIVFSESKLAEWRAGVLKRREELFRRNWKNRRNAPNTRSRQQEKNFQFVLEWYEEFDEVVARERERNRLDKLIAKGLDVNDPKNQGA